MWGAAPPETLKCERSEYSRPTRGASSPGGDGCGAQPHRRHKGAQRGRSRRWVWGAAPPETLSAALAASRRPAGVIAARDAVAIAVLAVLVATRGDAIAVGLLLGLVAGRLRPALGAGLALAAVSVRWGSTSLEAIAGAQAVLGPAGITGGVADVAAVWLAGVSLLLAGGTTADAPEVARTAGRRPPRPVAHWVHPVVFGVAAALAVAGPGPGGALWVRVVASVTAAGVCVVLAAQRRWTRPMAMLALAAGIGAVVLAVVGR